MEPITLTYAVSSDDFDLAGAASGSVKQTLKKLGFSPDIIRRVAIAMYEAEINMVIHANGGNVTVTITPECIDMCFEDKGPGIPNVDLAMTEGWSTATEMVRDLGFGAGMGLPNIKKYTDSLEIESVVGVGTTVKMTVKQE